MIALLLALSLGQIDVRNDGGYVGRARDILDCRGGLACSVDAGVGYISAAGISGGGGGTSPSAVCGMDAGSALAWDGGAYYCTPITHPIQVTVGTCDAGTYLTGISTGNPTCSAPNGSGWVTALNCNFANEATQALNSDAGFTACGTSCFERQQAPTGLVAITNGAGLEMTPASATVLGAGTITCPRVHLQLQCLMPFLKAETPVRVTFRSTGNFAANFDQDPAGIWLTNGSTSYSFVATRRTWNASLKLTARRMMWNSDSNEVVPSVAMGTPNTYRWVAPLGLTNDNAYYTTVVMDAGTLPVGDEYFMPFAANASPTFQASANGWFSPEGMYGFDAFMSACRNSSGTALKVTWKELVVEYKP